LRPLGLGFANLNEPFYRMPAEEFAAAAAGALAARNDWDYASIPLAREPWWELAARHSLSLPGAPPPTPPDGRLPSAASGSAEWADCQKSLPGDGMGPGRAPRSSASILPPASQLGRRRAWRWLTRA